MSERVVYCIGDELADIVKIGTSGNVTKRLADLQGANAKELFVHSAIPGGKNEESALHWLFADMRVAPNREWFYNRDARITRWFLERNDLIARASGTWVEPLARKMQLGEEKHLKPQRVVTKTADASRDIAKPCALRVPMATIESWILGKVESGEEISMSQREIAAAVGASFGHVNETIKRLHRRGCIVSQSDKSGTRISSPRERHAQ